MWTIPRSVGDLLEFRIVSCLPAPVASIADGSSFRGIAAMMAKRTVPAQTDPKDRTSRVDDPTATCLGIAHGVRWVARPHFCKLFLQLWTCHYQAMSRTFLSMPRSSDTHNLLNIHSMLDSSTHTHKFPNPRPPPNVHECHITNHQTLPNASAAKPRAHVKPVLHCHPE